MRLQVTQNGLVSTLPGFRHFPDTKADVIGKKIQVERLMINDPFTCCGMHSSGNSWPFDAQVPLRCEWGGMDTCSGCALPACAPPEVCCGGTAVMQQSGSLSDPVPARADPCCGKGVPGEDRVCGDDLRRLPMPPAPSKRLKHRLPGLGSRFLLLQGSVHTSAGRLGAVEEASLYEVPDECATESVRRLLHLLCAQVPVVGM